MDIEQLEILRKKARNVYLVGFFITFVIAIGIGLYFKSFLFVLSSSIIGFVLTILLAAKPTTDFTTSFKKIFVLKSLQTIFIDLIYEPNKGIDKYIISETKMLNMGDRYQSNDYVSGKYKNINVVTANVKIEEEVESTDSEGNTHTSWVTIFLGRWMIFDFNKTFKANIQICEKVFKIQNYLIGEK